MTRSLTLPRRARAWNADPLGVGEQIVTALERRQAERHWLEPQTPLIWLYRIWPGLVQRLLRSQLARFKTLMNAGAPEEETN